jgi:hypothetical protein
VVALKAKHLAIIVPAIFVVVIGLAMAFGRWNAEGGRRFADLLGGRAAGVEAGRGGGSGRAAEAGEDLEHDASDGFVRGTTTFQDLADWGVAPAALRKLIGSEPGDPGMTVRDWCSDRGIGFGTVKGGIQALVDAVSASGR